MQIDKQEASILVISMELAAKQGELSPYHEQLYLRLCEKTGYKVCEETVKSVRTS